MTVKATNHSQDRDFFAEGFNLGITLFSNYRFKKSSETTEIKKMPVIDLQEVYNKGFSHGQELVRCNWINFVEMIDLDDEDIEECKENLTEYCWEADENYRQYSPFEFFAYELNKAENCEEAWDSYEEGIGEGIRTAVEKYFNKALQNS